MASDLWANVASGAVGGLLALGGSALLHNLRTRQEAKQLGARRRTGRERRIRRLYVLWLRQLEDLVHVVFDAINGRHEMQESQRMILAFHTRADSRIVDRLLLLETNPEGRAKIEKGRAAFYAFLPLCSRLTTTEEHLREALYHTTQAHDHAAGWVFNVRFPTDKYIPHEW